MSMVSDVGQLPNNIPNNPDMDRTRRSDDEIVHRGLSESKIAGKGMNSQTNMFNATSNKLIGGEHNTTMDLMYSYDAPKVGYSEDTIKRMNLKIKEIKTQRPGDIDHEFQSKIKEIIDTLNTIENGQAEYYSMNQVSQMMRSIHFENKLIGVNFESLGKEFIENLESMNQSQMSESSQQIPSFSNGKARLTSQSIFKEFNKQYKSELKFTENKYFYQYLGTMKTSGKKLAVECQKFQHLGKISALTAFLYELDEAETSMSTEALFQQIYECYERMHEYSCQKDLIIRFAEIKQAKQECNIWISYMTGVV